jgi:hypothetical protein
VVEGGRVLIPSIPMVIANGINLQPEAGWVIRRAQTGIVGSIGACPVVLPVFVTYLS